MNDITLTALRKRKISGRLPRLKRRNLRRRGHALKGESGQAAQACKPRLIHLDIHVVCWLYAGRVDLLSWAAREAIERDALATSPMVGLEIQYVREIGRLRHGPKRILAALRSRGRCCARTGLRLRRCRLLPSSRTKLL
jgi:hypothetical protein